jgi:4-hydroxy-2-oxoheptanedioate aldolase
MIETKQAIENIEAILDVEGIDGIYIGPPTSPSPTGKEPKLDVEDPFILDIYSKLWRPAASAASRRGCTTAPRNTPTG